MKKLIKNEFHDQKKKLKKDKHLSLSQRLKLRRKTLKENLPSVYKKKELNDESVIFIKNPLHPRERLKRKQKKC